jgi:hypothetical protein
MRRSQVLILPTNIALSCGGGFGALNEMEPTEAEKAKAERAQWLLYGIMIVMVFAPLVIFLLRSR